jgi:iron(III) transport system ATP-binding protein
VVFQDYALFPHLSVLDNVSFGLKNLARRGKLATQQIRDEAERAIALVGLKGFEKRFPHELSGGQQQRVALARAIAPRPSLILLDEPFSNLDVQVRLYLRQEVRDILKSVGASGVFVTHDQEEALSISDSLAVMRLGRVEQFGTPEDIYRHPQSRFVAGFVTQANFLRAERHGDQWQTMLGSFPVNGHAPDIPLGEVMVRQEELRMHPDPAGGLVVRDRQFLGREYRYTLTTPTGDILHARTDSRDRLDVGQTVHGQLIAEHPPIFPLHE